MASLTFGVDILPKTDNIQEIGSSTKQWKINTSTINGVSFGSNSLATVAQNITGAINELNSKLTSKAASSGGTDLSMVTTGEKYTWNNKLNASNVYNGLDKSESGYALDARQGKALNDELTSKVATSAIKNNLTTTSSGYVLDARQGKVLNDKIADTHYLESEYLTADKTAKGSYVTVLSQNQTFSAGNYLILFTLPFTIPSESGGIKVSIGSKNFIRTISTFGAEQYVMGIGYINNVTSGAQDFSISIIGSTNYQAKVRAYNSITVMAKRIS